MSSQLSRPDLPLNKPPHYALDLYQAASLFDQAGLPRNRRSLARYCTNNKLDCEKLETLYGEEWRVDEQSVHRLIAQLRQQESLTSHDLTRPGLPGHASEILEKPDQTHARQDQPQPDKTGDQNIDHRPQQGEVSAGQAETQPVIEKEPSALITQYKKRLEDKDGEIEFYRDELKERNSQIRDMKSIIDGQNELLGAINRSSEKIFSLISEAMRKTPDLNADGDTSEPRKLHVIDHRQENSQSNFSAD